HRDPLLGADAQGAGLVIDLVLLQQAFADWPVEPPRELIAQAPRLAAVLRAAAGRGCGAGDLAGMVRDVLRCWQEQAAQKPLASPLTVPAVTPWPTLEEWRQCGITAAPGQAPGTLRIVAVAPWRPSWLQSDEPVDAFPAGRMLRRIEDVTPGDPVWVQATGL